MILCESSSSSNQLAPGFRFHPTDEELVSYYLKRKVSGLPLRVDAIAEIDLYKKEPWELPSLSKLQTRDMEWYFFSPLDRKYSNKMRTNRGTMEGYWKTTGNDRAVRNPYSNTLVGMKKTLVFHEGRAPKGKRTNWVMHEYRLEGSENDATCASESTTLVHPLDSFVVCRIFQKHGSGPQNGAHYGAPFIAEEWEDVQGNIAPECIEGQTNGLDTTLLYLTNAQYNPEHDTDQKGHILESQQHNTESTIPKNDQSHADDQAQYQAADDPIADHFSESEELYFTLEDIFDLDKLNNTHGNMEENENDACIASNIASDQNDGYLELNDVSANANGLCTNNTFDNCFRSNFVNDANPSLKIDDSEILNNSNVTTSNEGVLNLQPYDYLGPTDGNYLEGDIMFYDAPSNDVLFTGDTYMNVNENPQFSPTASDFDLVDDLMAFFDGTENDLSFDFDSSNTVQPCTSNPKIISEAENKNYPTCIVAASPLENTNKNNMTATDEESKDGWNKSFKKHVTGMLGSISAPSAMAADSCKGKGIQIPSSSSSIYVSAGMIQIRGITVTEHPENWTLSKNGGISFIYTYANGAVDKSASFHPTSSVFGMLLGGGAFLFGIFALMLSLSMKLGVGVYTK